MNSDASRRSFLGAAVATGVMSIVPRRVLGGEGFVPPSRQITLAHIGMGTEGIREIGALLGDPEIRIVAVCDPNTDSEDYTEWSRYEIRNAVRSLIGNSTWHEGQTGCPGGREVGRQIVDGYYARQKGTEAAKACRVYADFREVLDKEKDLDAVKVMTPDHLHATICVAAMRKGKHVMVHKPLGNRMAEGRLVVETARQTKVATHCMAYGAGAGNAAICQRIKAGVIGPLREIHCWTNRPVWPQYSEIPTDRPPVPKGLDWDLWLGPALDRPYSPHYTHTVFRGWYDFGGGSMADMGIYALWPVLSTLDAGVPQSAEPWTTHSCSIVDHISRADYRNDFSYPTACSIRFKFAAQKDMPAWDLFWYDGGMKPRVPDEILALNYAMGIEGIFFVGEQGTILAGFNGQDPQLFAKGKLGPLSPGESAGSARGSRGGQKTGAGRGVNPWVAAAKGGPASPGNFLNAVSITDTVNLGSVALRAGTKVVFDSAAMKITNVAAANKYLVREYRKGWELSQDAVSPAPGAF